MLSVKSFLCGFACAGLSLGLGVLSQMACARAEPGGDEVAVREVREFLREAGENEVRRDRAAAERLLADDFVRTGPHGEVWDKPRMLANFPEDDGAASRTVAFEDERIRVYGDVAVVTGLGVVNGAEKSGRVFKLRNRCTFVLVKSEGRWRAVATHQTRAD